MLWLTLLLLISPAWFFLILPWLKKNDEKQLPAEHMSMLLRDRLRELEGEYQTGFISESQYAQMKDETQAMFVAKSAGTRMPPPVRRRHVLPAILLLVIGITASMFVYLNTSEGYHTLLAMEKINQNVEQLLTNIEILEKRLEQTPDDLDGWKLLAEAHRVLGQYTAAAEAYERLEELAELSDVEIILDYAESLIMSENNYSKVQILLDRALSRDADNNKATFLYGVLNFNRNEYQQALIHWEGLYAASSDQMPTEMRDTLANMIVEARKRSAETMLEQNEQVDGSLHLIVRLHADLAELVAPENIIFVYVRAVDGPPMPLAVKRITVADLPAELTLDDNDTMIEGMSLSQFDEVNIFARVSRSGEARQQAGDLIGSQHLVLSDNPGEVVIDINEIVK